MSPVDSMGDFGEAIFVFALSEGQGVVSRGVT